MKKLLIAGSIFSVITAQQADAVRTKKESFFIGAQAGYSNLLFSGSKTKNGDNNNQNQYLRLNNKKRPEKFRFGIQAGFDSYTENNLYTSLLATVTFGGPKDIDYSTKGDNNGNITPDYGKAALSQRFSLEGAIRFGYRTSSLATPFITVGANLNSIKIYDNTDTSDDQKAITKSYNKLGYMLGAGIRNDINDKISIEACYKYVKILKLKHEFKGTVTADSTPIGTQTIVFDQHNVNIGLNVHF